MSIPGRGRFRAGLLVGVFVAATSVVVATAGGAAAGSGNGTPMPPPADSTPTGYTVDVSVRFSGDAAPDGGSRSVRVAPTCWWAPASGPYTDPAEMLAWYDQTTMGSQSRGILASYGPRSIWVAAVEAQKKGQHLAWYVATCRNEADYRTFVGGCEENLEPGHGPQTWVCYPYKTFALGETIPPPLVRAEDLAAAAREVMVIPVPVFDRNPKVVRAGQATLVGMATWFWVSDPAAAGGAGGTRTIRAEVGSSWAQVTAKVTGLGLSSVAGSGSCTPGQARTPWRAGTPEASACVVVFTKASVAYPDGYPVTATTRWEAAWTGADPAGAANGTLPALARTWVGNVRVAEVQTIVTNP